MQTILTVAKRFSGHVPTHMAADFEHILNRIGGGDARCKIEKIIEVDGNPRMFFEVSISPRRPFELRMRFTSAGWLHMEVAATRDGAALFFGLADILLQVGIDVWEGVTPQNMRTFADGLETT